MVAASNWLSPDKTRCYWPPFKSPDKCTDALMNRIQPLTAGKPWEMLNVQFNGEHVTLEQAQKATDVIKQTHCITGILKKTRLEHPQEMYKNLFHPPSVPFTSTSTSTMPADDKEEILHMLREIKSKVQENSTMLKKLVKKEKPVSDPAPSSTSTPSKDTTLNLNLPLKTFEDVERTEQELKKAKMRKKYIKYLSMLGGFGPKDVTKNIMQRVLTDDLAKEFNWQGRGEKRPFSRLALADIIKGEEGARHQGQEHPQGERGTELLCSYSRILERRLSLSVDPRSSQLDTEAPTITGLQGLQNE
ncbi:uncharacterized protein [Misgurnus anguillicaudatus]|uniref:uncharacterized protein n=1 Tax=Misgurnus anguillicaudatus TaxID=75329 RepID=UPI003CCF1857